MKVEPISDTAVSWSPSAISPRACSTAMRAESAVPVGERSTLPGRIATAALARRPSASRSRAPAKRQKEMWRQSGFSGWWKPSASLAARGDAHPEAGNVVGLVGGERKAERRGSTKTKLSPP